jgi:hypothetical protein
MIQGYRQQMISHGKARASPRAFAVFAVIEAAQIDQLLKLQLFVIAQNAADFQDVHRIDANGDFADMSIEVRDLVAQGRFQACGQFFQAWGHYCS